jgi:hypothetical protein
MLTSEQLETFRVKLLSAMLDTAYEQAKAELDDEYECAEQHKCLYNFLSLYHTTLFIVPNDYTEEEINNLVLYITHIGNLNKVIPISLTGLIEIIISGEGGSGGKCHWDDIEGKPNVALIPHTHVDNDINIALPNINQFQDRFGTSFIGTLDTFLNILMNKYTIPSFTYFSHNKATSYDLGENVNGVITFSWIIDLPANVMNDSASGSLTISEASPFINNDPFNLFGTSAITRTFTGDYTKTTPGTLTITLNGLASTSTVDVPVPMNHPSVYLTWYSRIWCGNDADRTVTVAEVEAFNSIKTNVRQISFDIGGAGYKYVFIPDNIVQTGIKFMDAVSGFEVSMNTPVSFTVTNPASLPLVGQLYRTKNSLGAPISIYII